jgi:hypothetical protein
MPDPQPDGPGESGASAPRDDAVPPTPAELLAAALAYAAAGWPVLPLHTPRPAGACSCRKPSCKSIGKHPRTINGLKDASADPDVIRAWWKKWPDANIGLRTDGRVVLDFDPKDGGLETLARWEAEHPEDIAAAPRNLTGVHNGRRGVHLRFLLGAGTVGPSVRRVGAGVDVRAGEGSLIVAAPSPHGTGVRYEWGPGDEPALPAWLEALLVGDAEVRPTLEELLAAPPEPGRRNGWLAQVCGHLALRYGDDHDTYVAAAMAAVGGIPDRTGFPDDEARRTIKSIWTTEHKHPVRPLEVDGPRIDTAGRTSVELAREGWAALVAANDPPRFFRTGRSPVRLEHDDDGQLCLQPLTSPRMTWELSSAATWIGIRDRHEISIDPPTPVVAAVLATPDIPLPVLTRFVEAPIFGPNGELQVDPGYHGATRTYHVPAEGFEVELPPEHPSDLDVAQAIDTIDDLLCDFPFATPADRAHAISLLLLPFVRELIAGQTPLHLFDKPTPGTGAGLLADVLLIPALGRSLASMSDCRNEEEWRKRITSALKNGTGVFALDNLTGTLRSPVLAAALTQPVWGDRILGGNEYGQWPIRMIFVATANNLQLSTDMARRTVLVRLDARRERPWKRTEFTHELPRWAFEHRSELVSAALCAVRAWIDRGRPIGRVPLGSYTQWAAVMGGLLEVLRVPGFLENLDDLYEEADAEGAANRWLVARWYGKYHNEWTTIGKIYAEASGDDDCPLDLGSGNDSARRHALALHLDRIRDRIFTLEDGTEVRIEKSPKLFHNQRRWRLATGWEQHALS